MSGEPITLRPLAIVARPILLPNFTCIPTATLEAYVQKAPFPDHAFAQVRPQLPRITGATDEDDDPFPAGARLVFQMWPEYDNLFASRGPPSWIAQEAPVLPLRSLRAHLG